MSTVAPYLYEGTEIRTIFEGDVILFVAADVARVLGYRDAHNLTRRIDDEDRGTRSVSTPSGDQDMTVITEPGLYAAVLGSQVSGAHAFKRWVTREVLPSIRRTGSYSAAYRLPQSYAEALRALAESVEDRERIAAELAEVTPRAEVEDRERIAAELAEVTPRAEAFDHFLSGDRDYSVGAAAKLLVAEGYVTGERRLFAELDERGWLFRREGHWHLKQYIVDAGYGRMKASSMTFTRSDGSIGAGAPQVRISARGLDALRRAHTNATCAHEGGGIVMIQTVSPTERDQTVAWTLDVVVRESSHGMRRLTIDCPESVADILADTWGLQREDGALRGSHLGVQIEVRS